MGFEDAVKAIDAELAEKETRQAALLAKTRDAIRDCAKAIKAIHVGETPSLEALDAKAAEIRGMDKGFEGIAFSFYQEYAEIKCFLALSGHEELPDYNDLKIPPLAWLSGLCDCVGELRRAMQIALMAGDRKQAEHCFKEMERIYDNVMTLNYMGSIVGGLKSKQDAARGQVERARSELLGAARG